MDGCGAGGWGSVLKSEVLVLENPDSEFQLGSGRVCLTGGALGKV